MCDSVALAIRPDINMEDVNNPALLVDKPPILDRQSSANSFFEFPTLATEPIMSPYLQVKCQRICETTAPPLVHLKSLFGKQVGIPASSVATLEDLQQVAATIYGVKPAFQRLFAGGIELTDAMNIPDVMRKVTTKETESVPVRVYLSLPVPTDPDATLGDFRPLPPELCVAILGMLPVSDVCAFTRTCKRMREIASDSKLWWMLYCRYWCPLSIGTVENVCCWKEIYKTKLEGLAPQSCEEARAREDVKQMLEQQAQIASAMTTSLRASSVNLGLLESCARRAIQFGAPAYNRRDFEACYRTYFTITSQILSYISFPRMSPLFRKGLGYLRNSAAMAKNAPDDSRRAWSYRHGFDSILLMMNLHRAAIKSTLNLGETYCTRHMWAEAEASINEALDMSFEAQTPPVFAACDATACHDYIFFMYVHCLLMQGKYVAIMLLLKDAMSRRNIGRLRVQCFRHAIHFVRKGLSAIDACLSCPHITCTDIQKLMLIRLYYVYVGSPTAEELAEAKQYCSTTNRNSTLACVRSTVAFFLEALATVEPRVVEGTPDQEQEEDEEESDDE